MAFQPEPVSTPPKLSLFSLPSKPPTLPDGLTPPPHTVAAIPFQWEEVPGKPRATITAGDDPPRPKSKTVRSLELPPRLVTTAGTPANGNNNARVEIIPSPTTVLGGPYASKSLSGSPEKMVIGGGGDDGKSKGKMTMPLRKLMRKDRSRSPVKCSSWRWDSFRDAGAGDRVERLLTPAPVKFCSWRWDGFRDDGGGRGLGGSLSSSLDDLRKSIDSDVKIGKVTRKGSFTFSNGATSGFLASMYGTLKHGVRWGWRRR